MAAAYTPTLYNIKATADCWTDDGQLADFTTSPALFPNVRFFFGVFSISKLFYSPSILFFYNPDPHFSPSSFCLHFVVGNELMFYFLNITNVA